MGQNIVQKIIDNHIVEGNPAPGESVAMKIDQTLTQDATGTMAYLSFEAMGVSEPQTDCSVSYIDHNTSQMGFENADDHRYLTSIAKKYGFYLSRPGNGICHQIHLERFGVPGKTLLGSDSHTPTGGGLGMLAIGAGGLDVACAMAGFPYYLSYPRVVNVYLTGALQNWVTAKDVILYLLEQYTTKGNVGWVFEFSGPGVETLSVPERATIANMGAETGVTCSVFPSDDRTLSFLRAQQREQDFQRLEADADATYESSMEIDLSTLEPRMATPHSPGNIALVKDLAGKKVDQVCVGSCTNASYQELMRVAQMVQGQTLPQGVSFALAPGSKQVMKMLADNGALSDYLSFGARIMEAACGFCIGNGLAPSTEAVSIRTSNRNFKGRSGTQSAGVYLASPETAAACALRGVITDPRNLDMQAPRLQEPEKFTVDDSLISTLAEKDETTEIYRGPNIGEPPATSPLEENVSGLVTLKVGDKITTDHIMPAGSRLKYRSNIPKYAEFVFESVDDTFPERCLENKENDRANFVLGGASYGQGSSREHAAICPAYLGVSAVIAKSVERIHRNNLINFGILPLPLVNEEDYDRIDQSDELKLTAITEALKSGQETFQVQNVTKGLDIPVHLDFNPREIDILLAGGLLDYIRRSGKDASKE